MDGSRFSRITRIVVGGSEQFRRNFVGMAAANILAQAVGVLALPALSRTFTPADFGALAIFVSLQAMILAVVTGRFDWLMPNAQTRREAAGLLALGLICTAAITFVTAAAVLLFRGGLAGRMGMEAGDAWLLWFLPPAVAVGGVQLLLWTWHVHGGELKAVSLSRVTQAVVTLLVSVGAGLLAFGAVGLILGFLAGLLASLPMLLAGQGALALLLARARAADLAALLRRHWREAGASLAVSVVNNAMSLCMPFLLAHAYNVTVAGWYGLVMRVATAPVGLVTNAITHSFWADAAKLAKDDPVQLRRFYFQSMLRLSLVALPVVLICLAGPLYIGPLFGRAHWDGAGALLAAVTPYLFAIIVFGPTSHLMVYGRQGWQFWCDLSALLATIAVVLAAGRAGAPAWVAVLLASLMLLGGYGARVLLHLIANRRHIAAAQRVRT